jgi:O-antigen ligase
MVIFFTFSRSAWLGLFIGLLVIFVVFKKKLICAAPLVFLLLLNDKIKTRLTVIFTGTYWFSSSLDGRLWAINNGLYLFEKYPLFGTGPGTYGGKLALNYASPIYLEGIQNGYVPLYFTDNQWLQLLIQSGFFCTVIFVLFILAMFYYLLVRYNKTKNVLNLGILGAFVSFLVAGVFGNVLEFGAIAVPMGIILGAAFDE